MAELNQVTMRRLLAVPADVVLGAGRAAVVAAVDLIDARRQPAGGATQARSVGFPAS